MIPLDYHIHSLFSEDGEDSPETLCQRALELGIPEIGFSEHWDVGPYEKNPRFFKIEPWYDELERLRNQFDGKLIIRAGVELAEPHLYAREANEMLKRAPFDFIMGSIHFNGTHFMFDEQYFHHHPSDEVYSSYFTEVERMLDAADIDIVSHLDIPARTGKPIIGYEPSRYEKQIRRILAKIIRRKLALDINTAGMRKPACNLMPDPLILKWYAEMEGVHITLGSDAHRKTELGLHLNTVMKFIKATGFTHVTHYDRRQAYLLPI